MELDKVVVTIETIRVQNDDSGFIIFLGSDFDSGKEVSVKGFGHRLSIDDLVECDGYWKEHPDYGPQFEARKITLYTPNTSDRVLKYLESGYIKGIRKATAKKIFDMFGEESLNIIDNNPNELNKISGIGAKTLAKIIEDWSEKRLAHKESEDLNNLGFSIDESFKILRFLGENALKTVLDNPYCIANSDELRIKFDKIDEIALSKLGYEKDNITRVMSYLLTAINEQELSGHTYIEKTLLIDLASKRLKVTKDLVDLVCEAGILKEILKSHQKDGVEIIQNFETYEVELSVTKKIKHHLSLKSDKEFSQIELKIKSHETNNFKLSKDQKVAIKDSLSNKINIVNGGPGVGKTTILGILIKILDEEGYSFKLCAYTGKASQRMSESTDRKANTVHKTLEYNPKYKDFQRNQQNPLETDFLIVDEASMIDIFLFNNLIKSLSDNTVLIMIGDVDQIPSISAGSILRDLIGSKKINVSHIKELQRQAKNSKIIKNAYLVNEGKDIVFDNDPKGDFFFMETSSDDETLLKIEKMVSVNIPKAFKINPKKDLQILTPTHENQLGRKTLNKKLQDIYNPSSQNSNTILRGEMVFRENDNIMQVKNNYDKDVMNGDCGIISNILNNNLSTVFDGDIVSYKRNELDEIELSYCITLHKSQGSEYPVVIMPISHRNSRIMDRSLLYTGMTRGKVILIMIGSIVQLKKMIQNDFSRNRKTFLTELLISELK